MVDDRDATDETVRHAPTLKGVGASEDVGVAETVAHTPPAPADPTGPTVIGPSGQSSGNTTRPLGPRPRSASTPPSLATDRYTLGAMIGQGGMGEVVLAFDEQIGREVAVKRIRTETPSADELSRFMREARVQGRLQHPAVVPVHDLALDPRGKPYFVMKRLQGTTMSELLERVRSGNDKDDETNTRRRLLRAFADVCLATEFAHSVGIIHRDLKPANIMLGDFGEVYVLDWGVARAVTDADDATGPSKQDLLLDSGETRAGTVLGTPAYMAPEQLAGERAGPAADIYALGCILYEIAAGSALHGGRRSITSMLTPIDAKPSSKRPDSPPELDAICERATQLDPEQRFTSARSLGNVVQAYLDGDRDLAVRRELAHHHIASAKAALARGSDETSRRDAMRAAGRALALDPTASEAADLVTRLMLEPPAETPAEVEAQVARLDTESARTQGRLAAYSMIGYLAFVPLLLWTGVRSMAFVGAFAALAMASGIQVWMLTRGDRIPKAGIYLNALINAALIAIVCRMVGPFIIAPTLVTTTLMAYAAHPSFGSIRIVATILGCAVAVPWALEGLGVLESTYRFANGELILSSPVMTFSAAPVQIAFAALLVALVAVVALLTRVLAVRQRDATRKVELQAWHLRQILPTAPAH
ncbi:MAG: serine/threonine protein kinase [Deltaproteobacteria bacterium]|nr:serine/threonine protein kinase [Deltaproteobacteria bacterium]